MALGGKRPGAGRPRGSLTKKTREIAVELALTGTTPLEIMLKAMFFHADAQRWDEAAAIAKDAAPYVHPRLTAVEHSGHIGTDFDRMDIGAIQAWIAQRAAALLPASQAAGMDDETKH